MLERRMVSRVSQKRPLRNNDAIIMKGADRNIIFRATSGLGTTIVSSNLRSKRYMPLERL